MMKHLEKVLRLQRQRSQTDREFRFKIMEAEKAWVLAECPRKVGDIITIPRFDLDTDLYAYVHAGKQMRISGIKPQDHSHDPRWRYLGPIIKKNGEDSEHHIGEVFERIKGVK